MGTDYELLHKNCCSFAHEVCTRFGVEERKYRGWCTNEDVVNNVENSVRSIRSCTATTMDGDYGYELILIKMLRMLVQLLCSFVIQLLNVESAAMRTPHTRGI